MTIAIRIPPRRTPAPLYDQIERRCDQIAADGCPNCGGPVTIQDVVDDRFGDLAFHFTCDKKPTEDCEVVMVESL